MFLHLCVLKFAQLFSLEQTRGERARLMWYANFIAHLFMCHYVLKLRKNSHAGFHAFFQSVCSYQK